MYIYRLVQDLDILYSLGGCVISGPLHDPILSMTLVRTLFFQNSPPFIVCMSRIFTHLVCLCSSMIGF